MKNNNSDQPLTEVFQRVVFVFYYDKKTKIKYVNKIKLRTLKQIN